MFSELLKNVMNLGIITKDDVKRLTAIELMLLIIERSNGLLEYLKSYIEYNDKRVTELDKKYQQITDDIKKMIKDNESYFEEVIKNNLTSIALEQLNKWLADGTLEELINQTALKNVNDRITAIMTNHLTVSVKDFGAKGDGVTDDTQAIIDALESLKPHGGKILVPKTVAFITLRITSKSSLNMVIL